MVKERRGEEESLGLAGPDGPASIYEVHASLASMGRPVTRRDHAIEAPPPAAGRAGEERQGPTRQRDPGVRSPFQF